MNTLTDFNESATDLSAPVNVLALLDEFAAIVGDEFGPEVGKRVGGARDAVAELIAKVDALAASLESPTLVRPSTKNENAGFVDMRGWYGLIGNELKQVRAASARCKGGAA